MKETNNYLNVIIILIILFGYTNPINIISVIAQTSDIEIVSHSYYKFLGRSYVVGEVKNIGSNYLENVMLLATFYDENNTVLATSLPSYTKISVLEPKQKAPFLISSFPYFELAVDHYDISIGDYLPTTFNPYRSFQFENISTEIQDDYFYIFGDISNIGFVDATWVGIAATYYDEDGIVIGTSNTNLDPGEILKGEKVPFQISTYPRDIIPSSYILQAYCRESDQYPSMTIIHISNTSQIIWSPFKIYGTLNPALPAEEIKIKYQKPDGSSFSRVIYTQTNGSYSDIINPDMSGEWKVEASWAGNDLFMGSNSIKITFMATEKNLAIINCIASPNITEMGNSIQIVGQLEPSLSDINIYLTYTKPDQTQYTKTTKTKQNGTFSDEINPIEKGIWFVQASWIGNSQYKNSTSNLVTFSIYEREPIINDTTFTGLLKLIIRDVDGKNIVNVVVASIQQPATQEKINGITDTNGIILFDTLQTGNYTLLISKEGYESTTNVFTVFQDEIITEIIQIFPIYSALEITIISDNNTVINHAIVKSTRQPIGQSTVTGISSQQGIVAFQQLIPGEYIFEVKKDGFKTTTSSIIIEKNVFEKTIIKIEKIVIYGDITINVKDNKNNNIKDVKITIIDNQKMTNVSTMITSTNGSISITKVKEGVYKLIAEKKGFESDTKIIEIVNDEKLNVNLVLSRKVQLLNIQNVLAIITLLVSLIIIQYRYKTFSNYFKSLRDG